MNQYETERRLSWCYGFLSIFLGVSVICTAIPYNHWRATLDVCPGSWLENTNCGCIFYGVSTFQYFSGGHNSYCLYAIFAPLPLVVYALVMTLFHMYRVCINNIGQYESEKSTTVEEIEGETIMVTSRTRTSRENDAVIYCWIPTSSISVLFAIYNLVHSSIMTDGFLKTCQQYRGYLVRENNIEGVNTYSLHPGVIKTELGRHLDSILFKGSSRIIFFVLSPFMKTPELGAQTNIYCSVDEQCANETGLYYSDCVATTPDRRGRNDEHAKTLWEKSVELVKLGDYNPLTAPDPGVKN